MVTHYPPGRIFVNVAGFRAIPLGWSSLSTQIKYFHGLVPYGLRRVEMNTSMDLLCERARQ